MNTIITIIIIACIIIVGMIEGQAFEDCKAQTQVSYETCLAAHNIN
jgi:uncharacterized alpha/beta hydrolase family protein